MKIGTKSVLFGAHCWFIHPWFVALAWTKLYGFPKDIRLWVAFFVHDLGYIGKPNMDGEEGEDHVLLGAKIMHQLFDSRGDSYWYKFAMYHSRYYSKKHNVPFSPLCVADKLAVALEPWWLYLPKAILTGEIKEYMDMNGKYSDTNLPKESYRIWFTRLTESLKRWCEQNKSVTLETWKNE